MNMSFQSYEFEGCLDQTKFSTELKTLLLNVTDDILPIGDLKNIIVFIIDSDSGKILAHGSGGIYSDKSIVRKSENVFNSNINRSFWIDNVRSFVRRKGYGSQIVQEIEKFFGETFTWWMIRV